MGVTKDSIQLELTIGGEKAGQTLKDLRNDVKTLSKELSKLPVDTDAFKKKAAELGTARARLAEVESAVKGIGQEMAKTGSGFKAFASSMGESLSSLAPLGAAAVGAFAAEKLLEFGRGAVAAFNEAENAAFQMYNAMVTLGGESEETFLRLMDQADLLEQTTFGFTAEQIQAAQQQLKVFGLTGAEIEKLTPKILDYATVTGKDLAASTDDITKALLGKTKALEQVGIHLDDSQKTVQGVTNSLDKFAGSATAALDVGTNKTEVFSDMWGKVEEAVGGFLVGAGIKLLEWLSPIGESLAYLWGILTRVYDGFMAVITPIAAWINRMAEAYPIIGKIRDAIVSWATPFSMVGMAIKSFVTLLGTAVAGAIAGVKTIKDLWGEFATYATNIWGNIGEVIKTAFTDPFNIGAAVEKLKKSVATAAGDIAGTFKANYNAALASFSPIPEPAAAQGSGEIKDRKIKNDDDPVKAKEKELAEIKKLQDKDAKEEQARQRKEEEERIRFRELYNKRLLEGNKLLRQQEVEAMEEGLARELALIDQKKQEQLQKIGDMEVELTQLTGISAEERAALAEKYAQMRTGAEEKAKNEAIRITQELQQKQAQMDNDANIAQLERMEQQQELVNRAMLAQADIEILGAVDNEDKLLQAKINRLTVERNIRLQNTELTEAEETLIIKKYETEVDELRAKYSEDQKARDKSVADEREKLAEKQKQLDKEVADAAIGLSQQGLSALSEFSGMASDKQVSDADRVKTSRMAKLEEEKRHGRISEKKYAKEKERIEKETQRKIAAVKRKQAESEKQLAIIQSGINTAVAVTAALTKDPTGILATFVGLQGLLQTALIIAKPIPEFSQGGKFLSRGHRRYDVGGIPDGPRHSSGGISLIDSQTGEKVGEMEGGEMYHIYSRETTKNNRWLMDRLLYNSLHRNGAPVFAAGGVVASSPVVSLPAPQGSGSNVVVVDLQPVVEQLSAIELEIRSQKTRLEAYITYTSIEESLTEVNNIRSAAGL